MSNRKLKLGAFLYTPGNHAAGWRHPDAVPETCMDFRHYVAMAHTCERGMMDMLFFQDSAAIAGSGGLVAGQEVRPAQGRQAYLEPGALIAALAAVTTHLGLVATATTTYNEPYHIARRFLTVDHISGGRAGWNLVTSQTEDEAGNFGFEKHVDHALRYERAEEFYDVVTGLWDSWEDDAFLHDKQAGIYFDVKKLHFLRHVGKHFRVRGPLNVARSPQGRPVVAQAGSSEVGRELASRTADLIFTAQTTVRDGREFCADIHARAARYGRAPDDIRILPGLLPVVGRTQAEAEDKFGQLQDLLTDDYCMQNLSRLCGGLDISTFPPDGPLPELPPTNAAKARQQMVVGWGQEGLTIRQIARRLGASQGHRVVYGSPQRVADLMEEWLLAGACDGFNLLFPYFPTPLDDFVSLVVPELQRRGIYRTAYEGPTLRDILGVPVPRNRFTA